MKRTAIGVFLISVIFISGCMSVPEPVDQKSTLFIGKIIMAAKGYESLNTTSVNGFHKTGIRITIRNVKDNRSYTLISGNSGMFYSAEIPQGDYIVSRYSFRENHENTWSEISGSLNSNLVFHIISGKVNNIGVFYWYASENEGVNFYFNKDYSIVLEDFKRDYNKSQWLDYEWIDIMLNRRNNTTSPLKDYTML